jgi:Uma2 family endonuclease
MKTTVIDRSKSWTVEDYLLLGELSTPCELINGELVMSPSPSPYHQTISSNLNDVLKTEAKKIGGLVFFSPIDLYIDQKNVFQPDLVYVAPENKHIITGRGIEGVPDLIVEIISPSNIFTDRNRKKKIYLQIGVKEYWIVDPAHKTLEIYTPTSDTDIPQLYLVEEGKVNSIVLPNLKFDLREIFTL